MEAKVSESRHNREALSGCRPGWGTNGALRRGPRRLVSGVGGQVRRSLRSRCGFATRCARGCRDGRGLNRTRPFQYQRLECSNGGVWCCPPPCLQRRAPASRERAACADGSGAHANPQRGRVVPARARTCTPVSTRADTYPSPTATRVGCTRPIPPALPRGSAGRCAPPASRGSHHLFRGDRAPR